VLYLWFGVLIPVLGFFRYTDGTIPPGWAQIALSILLGDILMMWGLVGFVRRGTDAAATPSAEVAPAYGDVSTIAPAADVAFGREPVRPVRFRAVALSSVGGVIGLGAAFALSVRHAPTPSVGPIHLTWLLLPFTAAAATLVVAGALTGEMSRTTLRRSAPLLGVLLSFALVPPLNARAAPYSPLSSLPSGAPWGLPCKTLVVYPNGSDDAARLALLDSPFWDDTVVPLIDQLDRAGLNITTDYDPAPGKHTGPPVHLFTSGSLNTAHLVRVDVDPSAVLTGQRRAYGVGIVLVSNDPARASGDPFYSWESPDHGNVMAEQEVVVELGHPDVAAQVLRHALARAFGIRPETAPADSAFGGRPWTGHDGSATFTSADIAAMRASSGCGTGS
jgi:hypothetical protein